MKCTNTNPNHRWCPECRPDVLEKMRTSVSEAQRKSWGEGRRTQGKMPSDHGERISKGVALKQAAHKQEWLQGLYTPPRTILTKLYRQWAIEEAGGKCQECGWDRVNPYTGNLVLETDHINGDRLDNRFENIRVLCPGCHSMTPTYGFTGGRRRPTVQD